MPLARDGEPEVHGREGMGHDDVAGLVKCEVMERRELDDRLIDLRFVHRSQVADLLAARRVPLPGERVIDGPAHTLDSVVVHGSSATWTAATVSWPAGEPSYQDRCCRRCTQH